MARIQILSEQLCNKIAAGEVVERPASVVKELLENSLDAGADEIVVELERGGKSLIRVSDNGCGMLEEDAFLCLERHATSKIRHEGDLASIGTLGFRGEALPSIASVSRLLLTTRAAEAEAGSEIYIEGGGVKRTGEVGMPVGTTIEVRNLFFNTPARRKFLRRDETELGHISDMVTKQALGHPGVRFTLAHQGRTLVETRPGESLTERVAALMGRQVAGNMLTLEQQAEGLYLHGLLAPPDVTRATTANIYFFINGRVIRDRVVQHALLEGYRGLMMKGRYPVMVLFLDIDPQQVDVNVHPTKHEVRFQDQRRVHDFLVAAVRNALRPAPWASGEPSDVIAGQEEPRRTTVVELADTAAPDYRERVRESLARYASRPDQSASYSAPPVVAVPITPAPEQKPESLFDSASPETGPFGRLKVIGQFRSTYIVCEDGNELVLVDQHAGHERVRFEHLRQQHRARGVERQGLMFPEVIEFDARRAAIFAEHLEELERLGFELEEYGPNAFALRSQPKLLAKASGRDLVQDVASELAELGRSAKIEDALDEVLITMACHSAVRAHHDLSTAEIGALFRDLDALDFKANCPHGRPILLRLNEQEIERLFKRSV